MRGSAALRTGVTPGGALAGPWVRNPLWTAARAVPSLDLRFADNKSLTDATTGASLVTFTRASSGTFVGSNGVLQTAVTDAPRFDHNPTTGESLGLLVEEARTNGIRNNTMVGAVAGTPGTNPTNWFVYVGTGTGVTTSIVGTGTEAGVNYVDIRFNGTPSASSTWSVINEPGNVIAAATGQSWTYSSWIKISAGSSANVTNSNLFFDESQDSTYVTGGTTAVSYLTSTWQRYSASRTLSGGATVNRVNAGLRFSVTSGQAIDITLRIGLPQLEQGAFATSAIPTTSATATRAADVASITGSNFSSWYNQTEGTVFTDCSINYTVPGTMFPLMSSLNDGTSNNRIENGFLTSTLAGYEVVASGSTQVGVYPNASSALTRRLATNYQLNNFAVSVNGGSVSTDTSGILPTVSQLRIGDRVGGAGNTLNGTIRRLTYFSTRLNNEVLQRITQ